MRDYTVCWRGDLADGFNEEFFVVGSYSIHTYNLVRADNMYNAVDIFLENTLDYAYNDDPVFLDDVKEQVIEEFVYLICDEDEPNHIIPKRFSTIAEEIFNKYIEECEKRVASGEAVTCKVDSECRNVVINSLDSKKLLDSFSEREIRNLYKSKHEYSISVVELTPLSSGVETQEDDEEIVIDSLWKNDE